MTDSDKIVKLGVSMDTLMTGLTMVQEHIRFADAKAALIATFHVAILGFLMTQVDALGGVAVGDRISVLFWLRCGALAGYGVSTAIGFCYAVACIWPRMGESAPPCFLHAGHVARHYQRDYRRYCEDIVTADEKAWSDQIASQIVENCNISTVKFNLVGRAAQWTVAAVVLWGITLVATVLPTTKERSPATPAAAAHIS